MTKLIISSSERTSSVGTLPPSGRTDATCVPEHLMIIPLQRTLAHSERIKFTIVSKDMVNKVQVLAPT